MAAEYARRCPSGEMATAVVPMSCCPGGSVIVKRVKEVGASIFESRKPRMAKKVATTVITTAILHGSRRLPGFAFELTFDFTVFGAFGLTNAMAFRSTGISLMC